MPNGLVDSIAQTEVPEDRRVYGIVLAQVIDNMDITGLGRVRIHLPWLPEIEPWARVAVLMAGTNRGTFFIPQVGDEVLVAFNHGDLREPYVLGSLWNGQDRPPTSGPEDPITKRIIRTPMGHRIEFDDLGQSITITSSTQQQVTIDPDSIEIATTGSTATLSLDKAGNVSIQSARSIELQANNISIQGNTVEIKGNVRTSIDGGQLCDLQAGLVKIN